MVISEELPSTRMSLRPVFLVGNSITLTQIRSCKASEYTELGGPLNSSFSPGIFSILYKLHPGAQLQPDFIRVPSFIQGL